MSVASLASDLYASQDRIFRAAVRQAIGLWGQLDPAALTASWVQDQIGDQIYLTVARAQELAASAADVYTSLLLAANGTVAPPEGRLIPSSLAGVASDGRPLDSLLLQPLIQSTAASANGASLSEVMQIGTASLTRIVGTQVSDAGRSATGVGVASRVNVGYVRLVNPGACARCVILAGRFYKWSSNFDRHPLCKCVNVPTSEDVPGLRPDNDPLTHFNALSETEQNRQFTKAGANAIRDGADITRVVNARRGALGLNSPGALTNADRTVVVKGGRLERTDVAGRPLYVTTDGVRRGTGRGRNQRLMPESIYQIATDRADAVRMLQQYGYIR